MNNAAGNFYVPSESMSPNAWRSVVEIDLFGTFFCSQAALPHMRASGGGSIVNILDDAALPRLAADGARDRGERRHRRAHANARASSGHPIAFA